MGSAREPFPPESIWSRNLAASRCFWYCGRLLPDLPPSPGWRQSPNGVQAFREPKSRNAAATLGVMGLISITMFLGISTLARLFDVRISEGLVDQYGTVISQIGRAVFNGGIGFWILQVFTAGILILAANTAYQDFPRLSAILARFRFMPRQFRNRGDRLVFSNGVFALAALAGVLLVVFDAQVSRLIQLYVVGVFTSFTLSQTGMVRHWLRTREAGWRRSVVINGIGALTTGVVLVVVAVVKFAHGAWIVIVAVPLHGGVDDGDPSSLPHGGLPPSPFAIPRRGPAAPVDSARRSHRLGHRTGAALRSIGGP